MSERYTEAPKHVDPASRNQRVFVILVEGFNWPCPSASDIRSVAQRQRSWSTSNNKVNKVKAHTVLPAAFRKWKRLIYQDLQIKTKWLWTQPPFWVAVGSDCSTWQLRVACFPTETLTNLSCGSWQEAVFHSFLLNSSICQNFWTFLLSASNWLTGVRFRKFSAIYYTFSIRNNGLCDRCLVALYALYVYMSQ